MANKIILKKSSVAAKVPLSTDLEVGEVAINLADKKLYSKDAGGTVIRVSGDVDGPTSSTDNALARFDGTTGQLIQNSAVTIADDGATVIDANSTSTALRITQTGTGNALVVEDSTNPDSTPFVVDASGNIYQGQTLSLPIGSPIARIFQQFSNSTSQSAGASFVRGTADVSGAVIALGKSRATAVNTYAIISSGDSLGAIRWAGDDGVNLQSYGAEISAAVDGTPGTNDMPGRLVFSTTADGASSPTERMRITSAGNVGIGVAPNVDVAFHVGKNITGGATAQGIRVNGTVQSDVTALARGVVSGLSTAASTFTIGSFSQFYAFQGTIGAGSAVTSQHGFFADSSIIGATNNYGFFSNIASGTGRWNFYANGTAANYFAGSTTFADSTAPIISAKIGPDADSQHTLPNVSADTVTLNGATQTLTGKTISGASNTLTVDGTNEVGFRNIPQNSESAAYTLVLDDAGRHIFHPSADTTARTFTIPANSSVAFPIGTAVTFINQNGAGVVTIAITTDTMRLAGAGTTGSRTLAANGVATAIKLTSTEWIISGTGLT